MVRHDLSDTHEAFGEFVRTWQLEIRVYLARRVGDAAAADDLAQEVFVAAMSRFVHPDDHPEIRAWLKTVARNKAVDYLRRKTRQMTRPNDELDTILAAEQLNQSMDPETENEDSLGALRNCLAKLAPDSRQLIQSYYFAGQSAQSIAAENGQKGNAVRMALLRIRKTLGKCIRNQLETGVIS